MLRFLFIPALLLFTISLHAQEEDENKNNQQEIPELKSNDFDQMLNDMILLSDKLLENMYGGDHNASPLSDEEKEQLKEQMKEGWGQMHVLPFGDLENLFEGMGDMPMMDMDQLEKMMEGMSDMPMMNMDQLDDIMKLLEDNMKGMDFEQWQHIFPQMPESDQEKKDIKRI